MSTPFMPRISLWTDPGAKLGILVFLLCSFSPPLTEIGFVVLLGSALVRAAALRDATLHVGSCDAVLGLFIGVLALLCAFSIAPLYGLVGPMPDLALTAWGGTSEPNMLSLVCAAAFLLGAVYFSYARRVWVAFEPTFFGTGTMRQVPCPIEEAS